MVFQVWNILCCSFSSHLVTSKLRPTVRILTEHFWLAVVSEAQPFSQPMACKAFLLFQQYLLNRIFSIYMSGFISFLRNSRSFCTCQFTFSYSAIISPSVFSSSFFSSSTGFSSSESESISSQTPFTFFLFSVTLQLTTVSLNVIIGSDMENLIPLAKSSQRSFTHLSKWISPHVDRMYSPYAFTQNCTLGSDLSSLTSPSLSLSISDKVSASIATLTSPRLMVLLFMKLGHTLEVDTVAVLSTVVSKSARQTMQPAGASSITWRFQPPIQMKMWSMVVSIRSDWPLRPCLGPMTKTDWPLVRQPEKTRAKATDLTEESERSVARVTISQMRELIGCILVMQTTAGADGELSQALTAA